jgi:hypothetical protein
MSFFYLATSLLRKTADLTDLTYQFFKPMQAPASSHCCSACFRTGAGVRCVGSAQPSSSSTWCSSYSSALRPWLATGDFPVCGVPCYGIRWKVSTSERSPWVPSLSSASRRPCYTGSTASAGEGSSILSGHSGGSTWQCPHCAAGALYT